MSSGASGVLRQIQRLFREGTATGLTEWQLLQRYVSGRDDAAFEALLSRHGPMVLGVCRRMLDDPRDVEDAFQATFLVLVRRARSLREHDVLGLWLFGVASRVALRARSDASRRRRREPLGLEFAPEAATDGDDPTRAELGPLLAEECRRLPAKYCAPIVLCYLEGRTYEEAARQLGWPVNTVKGRLARARDQLRSRLARRGLAPTAAVLTATLSRDAKAAVPEVLASSTTRSAPRFLAGRPATGVATPADTLAEGVLKAMFLNRMTLTAAALLVAGLVAAGAAGLVPRAASGGPAEPEQKKGTRPAPAGSAAQDKPTEEKGSYPIELSPEKVYESPELTVTQGKMTLKSGPVLIVPMTCERGVTGAMLIGNGTFRYTGEEAKPIEGTFRAAMLRFNPQDQASLVPLDPGKRITDRGVYEMSRHLMNVVFGHCWHSGKEALIPPKGSLTVVLYSKEHGDLLISEGGQESVVHNFTDRKTLYEKK